jgi:ATP synthase F1 gamma subunit
VIRAAEREVQDRRADGIDYSLILVGKKAEGYFRFRGYRIDAAFSDMSDTPTYEDARQVAAVVTDAFEHGDVDQVQLIYTRFLSVGTQRVVVRRFMPLQTGAEGGRTPSRARAPTTSSSPEPGRSSTRCCPATPRPASSPPCSTPPPRSTPTASGR